MTPVPFVDLQAQYRSLKEELRPQIDSVLDNAQFILGPKVVAFEEAFARYCGTTYSVALNSGTAALQLLLRAYGIRPGDEVILPANTFFATAESVLLEGATPVLVDCEESSALIDVEKIRAAMTPKTKMIIPVHLYGQPCDMEEISTLAREAGVTVIEDACQGHGATYKGMRAGSLADSAAFSFYPGKNLGAYGDGGGITTNNDGINRMVRMLRDHGCEKRYHHEVVGWNERLDGIQGAVLGVKLPYLDKWNALRRSHAAAYRERLAGVGDIRFIEEKPDREGVYHLMVIRTDRRDELQGYLATKEIQTGIHYPIPLHQQKAMAGCGYKTGDFPAAETLARQILSIPMFPELTIAQIDTVSDAIRGFFTGRA